jgi:hypothetical protein
VYEDADWDPQIYNLRDGEIKIKINPGRFSINCRRSG